MSVQRRRARTGLAFFAPTGIGVLAFFVIPVAVLLWLVTQRWDLLAPPRWIGPANLVAALTDARLWQALLVSAEIGVPALAMELALGLALGRLMAARLPGMQVARVAALVPWMVAPFTAGIVARWFFAPSDGLIAILVGRRIDLLADPLSAPLVVAGVVAWQGTGFAAVVYGAAASALPADVIAAARTDGAGEWAVFRHIEWPLLSRTTLFLLVTGAVQALGLYDVVVPLTGGGPGGATEPVSALIVSTAWEAGDFGRAAVQSVVVAVVALAAVGGLRLALPRPS